MRERKESEREVIKGRRNGRRVTRKRNRQTAKEERDKKDTIKRCEQRRRNKEILVISMSQKERRKGSKQRSVEGEEEGR